MSWVKISDKDGGTYGEKFKTDYADIVTINGLNDQIKDCNTQIIALNNEINILKAGQIGQDKKVADALNEKILSLTTEIGQLQSRIQVIQDLIKELLNG